MSNAVSSVISDYATGLDHVRTEDNMDDRRYVRLGGTPWANSGGGAQGACAAQSPEEALRMDEEEEDAICAENLVISIVACLARAQYKLQISIQVRGIYSLSGIVIEFSRIPNSRYYL